MALLVKRCARCRETKPASEFYCKRAEHDGLQPYCKDCAKIKAREWQEDNRAYVNWLKREGIQHRDAPVPCTGDECYEQARQYHPKEQNEP